MIEIFLKLIASHCIMDYWAQSDALAKMKNRHNDPSKFCPPGQKPQQVWFYALSAHSIMHGVGVGYVTGRYDLAVAETVSHWFIDFFKCENLYGIHIDQTLHIMCKFVWLLLSVWYAK